MLEASDYSVWGGRTQVLSCLIPGGSSLRDRFTGKEDQEPDFGVPYTDFGARIYSPKAARWTVPDPESESYYGISPYAYCAGDPVNLVDPYGKDIYTMDANGSVILYQETDDNYDCVYAEWGEGPLDPNATHVKLNDKSILPSLVQGNNPSINCSRSDMKELFKFAANTFDGQEWGLYHNKDSYELTTDGKGTSVGTSLEGVTWKAHSHPNVPADDKSEMDSMGYWTYDDSAYDSNGKLINHNAQWYESPFTDNDATQFINGTVVTSFVYFPVSGNTYKLTKNRLPYKTTIK